MRSEAELRGPRKPFVLDATGEARYIESELEAALQRKGYYIRDNRIDIHPKQITHLNFELKGQSFSPG